MALAIITALRRWNKRQEAGLKVNDVLDARYGEKRSEQIQEELCQIALKFVKQLRIDRKEKK